MDSTPLSGATHILVVDDNKDAADSLAMLLELEGNRVAVAHSGKDALALAQDSQPKVAILDIGLPDMSGYDVARAIRSTAWGKSSFIIALTGWGQLDDKRKALDSGFDQHFTKPADPDAIAASISAFLNRPHPPSVG